MPSLLGHAVAGLAISAAFHQGRPPRRVWALAAACAVAPDLDWFTGFLPFLDASPLAHRGLSHSLAGAALLAALAMVLAFRTRLGSGRLWGCMLAAAFSHGALDALTFGGTGVALFLPFADTRYFCHWQPIFVSPIPLNGRLFDWFLLALGTELLWIGLPAGLLWLGVRVAHRPMALKPDGQQGQKSVRIGSSTP